MPREKVNLDANEATAYVAHKTNEVIAIYPITPSSNMGEWADQWSAERRKNLWGTIPSVVELQSEGGASGAVHGALQSGALTTTFTASQGLLLMIPNMFKIAGELNSTVFHVSARAVAAHALSIFGDHSDVMSVRSTGFALLCSNSVQEAMDMALIAQAATLEARIPFLHFFDGFRTSHEVHKVELLSDEDIRAMINDDLVAAVRKRALSPDHPVLRGTAQNPDVFFQARETVNKFYTAVPGIVQKAMDQFAKVVGRQYHLFEYVGHPEAERVIILMGSGAEAAHETVEFLMNKGEKIGVLKVRLYRPFSTKDFIAALPKSVRTLAVLDRTKEPGAMGEPMYLDVMSALLESSQQGKLSSIPKVIGGRYGLSSKEFTPAMVKGVFDEMKKPEPKNHFTVGINDDVTNSSIDFDHNFTTETDDVFRGMFFGLGADGTVGANKNSIKIIGEETDFDAQGYFVYDSKKSGAITTSHLRFGKKPIHSTYLISKAKFVACHQFSFLEKYDMLQYAEPGSVFLLNAPFAHDQVWDQMPKKVQQDIIDKKLKFWVIDGYKVANETGMGERVNTIMQTCFFKISGVLPEKEAIDAIKNSIKKTYMKKGEDVVKKNWDAVDQTVANLFEVRYPAKVTSAIDMPPIVSDAAPEFVKNVTAQIIAGKGDHLPVSVFPVDGTFPTGTTQWEKRNITLEIPSWDPETCIQCGKCSMVCPHAVIRIKVYNKENLKNAPATFKHTPYKGKEFAEGSEYTLQIAPEDCTGCELCVEVCPAKNKQKTGFKAINMTPQPPIRITERENWNFFLTIPEVDRNAIKIDNVKNSQFLQPLFEFSGACGGCGETPYVKLTTQLFGDRMIVANATGCSSIYGGNLPTTPWSFNKNGRGPAWSNSLFEDNAEFGLGFRLTIDKHNEQAKELLHAMAAQVGGALAEEIISAKQHEESEISAQRERVNALKGKLAGMNTPEAKRLLSLADYLVKKSVWIMGGDGWAYDIGYGGLDHVLASGRNVNILVLDTEVYSNTGGQMSKATPIGAVAKFAAGGKPTAKKDLAMQAVAYRSVYVARVAMGANDGHTVKAFIEAEKYDGPSIIIAYSHCIAHGINLKNGLTQQKLAVDSGYWPLFRFNPALIGEGKNPFQLDSRAPKIPLQEYIYNETRFKMLTKIDPNAAKMLLEKAQLEVKDRWTLYERMVALFEPKQS